MAKFKFDKVTLNKYLNKYYALFAIVLVLIILGLGGFLLVYPEYQELIQVREEQLSTSELDLVQKAQYLQDLREMEENFQAQNLENYRNLDKVLFTRPQFPLLFTRLENIITSTGMNIINITYTPEKETAPTTVEPELAAGTDQVANSSRAESLPKGISLLSVNMTVRSSQKNWEAFKNLINTLQQNIQLIEVKNLSYSPSLDTYNLTFNMYYKEDDHAQD
ncbi:hypothetical protein KKC88_03320 [Patescibacteria group bacterium]|nr:hypothetical protein [Patescibacteria group bacterium]MBU1673013.1 hypothetical protein [Patescibacteria group bacterium]MBU1964172.1 hypothetical protein [Patescibacteria group bacterium]